MKVRVFGKTSDDKGTQLERLTERLLKRRGYREITLNAVGAGGSEIDIRAVLQIKGLSNDSVISIIGECKAYEGPVGMRDWLKFLGKVYTEKIIKIKASRAVFVALSGVNGNVAGAYEEFKQHDDSVELVSGDSLFDQVLQEFKLPSAAEILALIGRSTTDAVSTISLGYYDAQAFWIAEFVNSTFTLLFENNIPQIQSPELVELVSAQIQAAKHRDLSQEAMARASHAFARKFVLGQCLTHLPNALPVGGDAFPSDIPVTQTDIDAACLELQTQGIVIQDQSEFRLADLSTNLDLRASVICEMLSGVIFHAHLDSDEWALLIDDDLLDQSLRIQDRLPIDKADRPNLIQLMKWSPSGLYWALNPDPILCGHRWKNPTLDRILEVDHARWYRAQMLSFAVEDFRSFGKILYDRYGLRELQFTRRAIFKNQSKAALDMDVTERTRMAMGAPDLGGGLIQVWLTEGSPEPWGMSPQK